MISKRTLNQWRKEALKVDPSSLSIYDGTAAGLAKRFLKCQGCILCMTQELLDLHLIKEGKE
jgi:hypothetical protein